MLWLVFAVALAIILYGFINWSAQKDLRDCGRSVVDDEFREALLAEISRRLAAGEDKKSPRLWAKAARLHYFSGRLDDAIANAKNYAAAVPGDSEGWAELAEYCLTWRRWPEARQAAAQALALKNTDDYRALAARAAMLDGDFAAARRELAAWRELDNTRLARQPPQRHFCEQPLPAGKLIPDPVLVYYENVCAALAGEPADAQKFRENNPDFWDAMLETRLPLVVAAKSPEILPFPPAQAVGAQTLALANFTDDWRKQLLTARAALAENFLPQIVIVICPDAPTRRAALAALAKFSEKHDKETADERR
jgi:hypothetical protein